MQEGALGRALENAAYISLFFRFLTPRIRSKFVTILQFKNVDGNNQCLSCIAILEIGTRHTHTHTKYGLVQSGIL